MSINTADRLGEELIKRKKMTPELAKDVNKIRYGKCPKEKKTLIQKISKILGR